MERSGNFYKAIRLGYILISILIGCMAYNSLYEWQEIEALELGNKKIDELRKEINLKSATKLFSVLLASKRPLITELADKLRLKYPLLPTISPCPTMRLEAIRSIIPISCRRYPKSV